MPVYCCTMSSRIEKKSWGRWRQVVNSAQRDPALADVTASWMSMNSASTSVVPRRRTSTCGCHQVTVSSSIKPA